MPFQKGHTLSKGNKGGGRKSMLDEWVQAQVINGSWERLYNKFKKKNPSPDDERLLDTISIEVAKKTIPKDINIKGEVKLTLDKILDECENG